MNFGEVETDIPVHLDNLLIGERYTFYHVNAPNVGIRATLINIIPGHDDISDRITFRQTTNHIRSVPLHFIVRITQSGIGPNDDTAGEINKSKKRTNEGEAGSASSPPLKRQKIGAASSSNSVLNEELAAQNLQLKQRLKPTARKKRKKRKSRKTKRCRRKTKRRRRKTKRRRRKTKRHVKRRCRTKRR
tara:strand:- start:350 stop:916 length:567 start_codon:yes stop_codon:yes gene_type:complete